MDFILKFMKVRREETKKVLFLSAFSFVVGWYFTLINSISISVFDIRLGAKFLPYVYFVFPLVNFAFSMIYLKKMPGMNKRILFRYFTVLLLVIHLFNYLVVREVFGNGIFIAVFLLLSLLVVEKLYFMTMVVLQNVVDVESIKRLLPVATGAFIIASIIAATVVRYASGLDRTDLLFLLSLLFIFPIAWFGDILIKRFSAASGRQGPANSTGGLREALGYIKGTRFILLIILLGAIVDITYNINDYLYNVLASSALPVESSLMSFVGSTESIRYILALLFDLFLFTRLVTGLGSLNAVKLVLGNIILGSALILAGHLDIQFILASKVIFNVMIMQLTYSLMQLLYQPVNNRYRDTVMVLADLVVILAGSIIGGGISLLHSLGILGTNTLTVISIIFALVMIILWQLKQSGYVSVIEKTMNFTDCFDSDKILGKVGLSGLRTYISDKIYGSSNQDKIFALGLIKYADDKDKEKLVKHSFKTGNIEVRLKISDMIFDGSVKSEFLQGLTEIIDSKVLQYLLNKLFINFRSPEAEAVFLFLKENIPGLDSTDMEEASRIMLEYVAEGKSSKYQCLLEVLSASQKTEDSHLLVRIMKNFIGKEDDINRSFLMSVMFNLKGYQGMPEDMVELCSAYDTGAGMDYVYLKEVFSGYCRHGIVRKVCQCYTGETVANTFKEDNLLIPRVYLLHALVKTSGQDLKQYAGIYSDVLGMLKELIIEKNKIQAAVHPVKQLLNEELERLVASVTCVVLDYLFAFHGVSLETNLEENLESTERRPMLCEIVQNSLPLGISREILPVINQELTSPVKEYRYSVLNVGGMHRILTNLYMILGGEVMEEQFRREVEHMTILKGVSIFNGLNLEQLYALLNISKFKPFPAGYIVIRKGDMGDKFYVVVKGEVGIYLDEEQEPIAITTSGGIFGEMSIIDSDVRTTTVKTFGEVLLLEFDGDSFLSMLKKNTDMAFAVAATISQRINTTSGIS